MKQQLKSFFEISVGSILTGEALRGLGGASDIPKGFRDASQSLVSAGFLGNVFKSAKDGFKWK